MPLLQRALFLSLLFSLTLQAAVFQEYYRSGQPVEPESQPDAPRAQPERTQPAPPTRRQPPVQRPRQQPAPPAAQGPTHSFGLGGQWLVRASIGAVLHSRSVEVQTRADSTDTIYYRPDNSEIGTADGSGNTLSHAVESFLFRPQIGLGYQWPGEGNFLTLDVYSLKEVQETLVQFHYTLPSLRVNTSIPFFKLGAGLSHTDSEGLSPTALSWSLGLGAYHALAGSRSWRLEYGLDYTQREWLSINHHYGQESWSDRDWHLYLGTAWRF